MDFETQIFGEPELEFGDRYHHPDPRLGLMRAGPLQPHLGEVIKVGVVGNAKTVEDTQKFFVTATGGFGGMTERHPNLHPPFPGLGNQNPFRCRFEIEDGSTAALSQSAIDRITREPDHEKAVALAVGEIVTQLKMLDEGSRRPDVAIVALPVRLIERVWSVKVDSKGSVEKEDSSGSDAPNFRGMLKARAMPLSFPIQIVLEDVLDDKVSVPRKIKEATARKIQDRADCSWNFFPTLYYKGSGRIPWRRLPREGDYTACYVGISFYREAKGQQLFTSAAQMFDERGRGFVLRGKRANTESRGRHPYMTRDDAGELLADVLAAYKAHHKNLPARVIVLKTSRFRDDEAEGILEALDTAGTELRDLVWVQESYCVKLLRDGNYPVLRGTFVDLGGNGLLYTNGSIPYYGTYPGLYDPRPLLLCPHPACDSTVSRLAEEIFSLTKINWNSTQMNQRFPIPIRAARMVGEVLKYMEDGQRESSDYRRYV